MIILILHIIISLIAGLITFRSNRIEGVCHFIISLLFPVGGLLIVIILQKNTENLREIEDDYDDSRMMLFTDRLSGVSKDVLAIDDFLAFGDKSERRQNVIEVLKRDSGAYIDRLKLALNDEDGETAHYVASAVSELRRSLDLKLQKFSYEYESNIKDFNSSISYYEVIDEYINSGILDSVGQKQYKHMAIKVLQNIIKKESIPERFHYKLVSLLIEVGEFIDAGKYSIEYIEKFKTEKAYLSRLSCLFSLRQKNEFDTVFNQLRVSNIKLTNKGLEIVRFWLEEVRYVKH